MSKGELKYDLLIKKRDKLIKQYDTNPTKKLENKIIDIESYIDKLIEIDTEANLRSPKDKKFNGHTGRG